MAELSKEASWLNRTGVKVTREDDSYIYYIDPTTKQETRAKRAGSITNAPKSAVTAPSQTPMSKPATNILQPLSKTVITKTSPQSQIVPSSQTTTSQIIGGPGEKEYSQYASAIQEQGKAEENQALSEAQNQAQIGSSLIDLQRKVDEENQRQRETQQRRKDFIDEQTFKLRVANKKIEEDKINPNRLMESQSAGDKILSGIALFLGGFGAGLTGQPNMALQIMENQIDRDIAAQMENKRDKQRAYENQVNLFQQNLLNFNDEIQAHDVTKAQMFQSWDLKLDSMKALNNSKQYQDKIATIQAGIKQKQAELGIKIAENTQRKAETVSTKYEVKTTPATTRTETETIMSPMGKDRSLEVRDKEGKQLGLAGTPKVAEDINAAVAATATITNIVDKLIEIRKTEGRTLPIPGILNADVKIDAEAKELARSLTPLIRDLENTGALDKGAMDYIKQLIPSDPTAIFTSDTNMITTLNTLKQSINHSMDSKLKQLGVRGDISTKER